MDIEQFIEENIDLIDNNDFTELYNRCSCKDRGKLTGVLYECGLDPLEYMARIPYMFASKSSVTSIIIPNSVTSIGYSAFSDCSCLTSVTIPDSVTQIGVDAFCDCGNIQITYSGTKQQWRDQVAGKKIFPGSTYVCNCSDGVVEA